MPVGDHLQGVGEAARMAGLAQEPVEVGVEHPPGLEVEHPVAVAERIGVPVEGEPEGHRRHAAPRGDGEAQTWQIGDGLRMVADVDDLVGGGSGSPGTDFLGKVASVIAARSSQAAPGPR